METVTEICLDTVILRLAALLDIQISFSFSILLI